MQPRSSSRPAFGTIGAAALAISLIAGTNLADAANRPPGHASPNATATPQPFPLVNGYADVFTFSETETVAYPSATPVAYSYTGAEADEDACPVTFDGISNLCDDQLVTSSGEAAEFYEAYVTNPSGQTPLAEYGAEQSSVDPPYTSSIVQYWTPYAIYFNYPQVQGQTFNDDDFTDAEVANTYGPNGYVATTSGAEAPDGSYKYVTTESDPATHYKEDAVTQVHSDGSAAETLTQTGYNKLTETFGAPVARDSHEVIPVTTEGGNAKPAKPEPKRTTYVPDWFPGGGAAPSPLQNEPTTYLGIETVPTGCGSFSGTQAGEVQQIATFLDPLAGEWSVQQINNYLVNGLGLVCAVEASTNTYYDNFVTGNVLYTITDTLTLALSSQYIPDARFRQKGWPVALPRLEYKAPPTPHMAAILLNSRGHASHAGRPSAARAGTLGERFAQSRQK